MSFRALVVVLVTLVGAGHILLDSCLFGCDAHASATPQSTAHCHESAASGDPFQWQATSRCGHDHGELSADVGSQPPPDAGMKTVGPTLVPGTIIESPDCGSLRIKAHQEHQQPLRSPACLAPLRV